MMGVETQMSAIRDLIVSIDFKGIQLDKLTKMDDAMNEIENKFMGVGGHIDDMGIGLGRAGSKGKTAMDEIKHGAGNAGNAVGETSRRTKELGEGLGGVTLKAGEMVKAFTELYVIDKVKDGFLEAANAGFEFDASMQQSQMSWETLLNGDTKAATNMMQRLQQMGAATPFEFEDLDKAAKKLQMAGWQGDNLFNTMTAVGDAVSAIGGGKEELDGVSTALFQMSAKGKVQAEEMQQLAERGLPVWDILAGKMGKSTAELMKMSQNGQLLSKDVLPLLVQGMEDKFGGSMDKQSKTWNGMISTFKDNFKMISGDLAKPLFDRLSKMMPTVLDIMGKFQTALHTGGLGAAFKAIIPENVMNGISKTMDIGKTALDGLIVAFNFVKGLYLANSGTIMQTLKNIWTVIETGIELIKTIWHIWGDDIMAFMSTTFSTVWTIVKDAFAVIGDLFQLVTDLLKGNWSAVWRDIKKILSDAWDGITAMFRGAKTDLKIILDATLGKVLEGLGHVVDDFISWGEHLIDGLIQGIVNKEADAVKAIKKVGSNMWDGVKDFFGIHSPSRLMADAGQFIVEGMEVGISDNAHSAINAAADMGRGIAGAVNGNQMGGNGPISAPIAPSNTTNNQQMANTFAPQITIHVGGGSGSQGGSNAQEISKQVNAVMEKFWLQMQLRTN